MKHLIHTPEGVRDIFGRECDKKRYLERKIERKFRGFGYQSIETPSFEYFEVFSKEVGTIPSRNLYKFFDREGNTLALRPDFTPSIARATAMYFAEESGPLRLCYHGNVYQNNSSYQGRLYESTEMGVEFINEDSAEADAEVIALVVETMQEAGLSNYQVTIGHVDYFDALMEEAKLEEDVINDLKHLLAIQNRFGMRELVEKQNLPADLQNAICAIPELFGNVEVLARAKANVTNQKAKDAIARLQAIYEVLKAYGCENSVTFDLGMITRYQYYTGIILNAYTFGTGDAIIKGGRYDRLMAHFGKEAAAVGFVVEVDSLVNAIERQNVEIPIADIKTMILYPAYLEKAAIRMAMEKRADGLDVACVRFAEDQVLDYYREYGVRNQFGGIVYIRSEEEAYAINLGNNEVVKTDISAYVG